ncbi:serine/threonine protein kinase [Micromonospora sp. NBC_01813]|uniref:serine/threonine protein kinase n=1 Tax=Micromonospora sp. NBC_01813 TaxID=2975988 RepID=UPI002DDBD16F|nr:serine/threonine protein kinase [Micromonospora sp. NBC_01813]WSA10353.1 serine/threonine protein kinase [Micromonospora sp. NBC_01813]
MTTAEAIHTVMTTDDPVDLFGTDAPTRRYHQLARLLHPDTAGPTAPDRRTVTAAFVRLADLWRRHQGAGRDSTTGDDTVTIDTRRGRYVVPRTPHYVGDLADLYRHGDDQLVKVPRNPANNDLIVREATALTRLADHGDARYLPYVPRLVDDFRHTDPATGAVRQVTVLGTAPGLRSLAEVHRAYPDGVDARDAAWMFRRLLVALGFAHRAGLVHGAVLPGHVLIEPEQHGVVLVDWCYASAGGEPVPAIVPAYTDWYPDEVRQRRGPGPGTDLAMAARCLTWLTGDRAPAGIRRFADGCRLAALRQRPDDAWRLLVEFDDLIERLWGPRQFRPFTMPDPNPR